MLNYSEWWLKDNLYPHLCFSRFEVSWHVIFFSSTITLLYFFQKINLHYLKECFWRTSWKLEAYTKQNCWERESAQLKRNVMLFKSTANMSQAFYSYPVILNPSESLSEGGHFHPYEHSYILFLQVIAWSTQRDQPYSTPIINAVAFYVIIPYM